MTAVLAGARVPVCSADAVAYHISRVVMFVEKVSLEVLAIQLIDIFEAGSLSRLSGKADLEMRAASLLQDLQEVMDHEDEARRLLVDRDAIIASRMPGTIALIRYVIAGLIDDESVTLVNDQVRAVA